MIHLFGYLDAGTGSMLIQSVFGIGLAASFVLRRTLNRYVHKFRSAVGRAKAE